MSEDETSAYSESRSSEEDDSELDLGFNNGNGATFFTGEEVSPQSNDGNGDAHVEHGGQEVVQHTAMSLLSSDGEDGENEDDSQVSQGNEPTVDNIPTSSICVDHNEHSPDPLYTQAARSNAMDERPSILLSDSFDDDEEEDTGGEEDHQAEGIARDLAQSSNEENDHPHEQDDEALSDAHVVELPRGQPDILVGSTEVDREDLAAAECMQEGGNTDEEYEGEVIIQGGSEIPGPPMANTLSSPTTVQKTSVEEAHEPGRSMAHDQGDDGIPSESQWHGDPARGATEGLEPTEQDINGEKDSKSSEPVPKQTPALTEIEEDLLDFEEEDLLDIEIRDICTNDPDPLNSKKVKAVRTPIPAPRPSKHKNSLEVSKSIDAARKALTGPHGKDNKKVHASAGDKGKDSRHPASAVLGQGGVKRKREPIPAPPPSRGGVATNIDSYDMDGFNENLQISVQDKIRNVVKKGRFSIEKWKRLVSNSKRKPDDQDLEYRSSDIWKNSRIVELKSSKVKVFQMDLQPDLKVVIEGEPLDSYLAQQDIILPDPRYIGCKEYDRGIEKAQGFLNLDGKKQLMGYTTNIRYDVLCELGSKDLKGVQDVQRHILERLRELKNRKRGVSAHLYCKQVSDDRDYDLGCRRLHAFVNDQSLKRRLLDCSIAKRRYVLATFGKVPFQLIKPCPGDYLVKLIEDRPSSSFKARTSPQANRSEAQKPGLHPLLNTSSKNAASNNGRGRHNGAAVGRGGKIESKRKLPTTDGREERKSSREEETKKPKREPIPVPPKRPPTSSGDGLKRSPRRRKDHLSVRNSKDSTGSRRAGSPSHQNAQPIPPPSKPTRRVVQTSVPSNSRLDSVVDSRPLAVARYDLNQMQQHVAPTWNGRNDGVMQQIRPQNIQQQQGLPLVAHSLPIPVDINTFPPVVNQQGVGGGLPAGVRPFQHQQAVLMMPQQVIRPQVQQPNSTLFNQPSVLNARQAVQNPTNNPLAQLRASTMQTHPHTGQLPGLIAVQPNVRQGSNLRLKSGGFLCADPARSEEPHPLMQLNEDAFFVCSNAIAVADGLGGTLQFGISSAEYSRSLTETSAKAMQNLIDESNGHAWTPKVAIEYACSRVQAQGSSTLCLLAFDPQQSILHAGKIGDGGYVVLRPAGIEDMDVISPWAPFKDQNEHPMGIRSTHYLTSHILRQQIGGLHPNHAIESQVRVQEGDVIVLATDGFFDVVYVHGEKGRLLRRQIRRLGMEPDMLARQLADLARHFAASNTQDCPICEQARLLDDQKTAAGVQPDDIAVVVAHVVKN